MTPKSDFLLTGARTITPKGSRNTANFGKIHCSLSKIMNNKQVLVYGALESTNDLRSVFVGHIYFKKLMKFQKFIEIFRCCMTRLRNTKLFFFIQCQYTRTIIRKKNMGKSLFKKHSNFKNDDEIFYCGMSKLKNTNLDVLIQCQYTRTILRKEYGTEFD